MLRTLAGAVLAGAFFLGATPTSSAQPQEELPPKLDVHAALAELADHQVYRAPGAVAHFDEAAVDDVLRDDMRILVAPYTGTYEQGGNYADGDVHYTEVGKPLEDWANKEKLHLIVVEGIKVSLYGDPGFGIGPDSIPELRQATAYLDATSSIQLAARLGGGMDPDKAEALDYDYTKPVPATAEQVDDLAGKLRADPVYNAPGRDDPIDPVVTQLADKYGISLRVAAFPVLRPGEPLVDYTTELRKRFPDDVVMVAEGRWLDVAAAKQDKADSARDYAYGRFEGGSFTQGSHMTDRIGTVLERLQFLLKDTAYGRPQPPPQPKPQPFDVRRTISDLTPWVLVGAAVVLGGAGLYGWRRVQLDRADAEKRAIRRESAKAMAKIGQLGAQLLATEERGETADPAAAERHETARTLYDQALTAKAMAEVTGIAEEGLAVVR